MSPRAIASATVSFGLVSIPVKVYPSGNTAAAVHFNWLHRKCRSRLKQQYYCPQDGEKVGRDEMAKGFEFSKGQFVLFSEEELKALQQEANQAIEITEFLPTSTIDPIYYEKSYYLGPDRGGERAYKLLARALQKSERSALAKYAARGKQYLVLVRPVEEDGLVMQQLRYADEVHAIGAIPLGDAEVKKAELELAMQIVDQAVSDTFRPQDYRDEVRARMLAAIERKVEGQEITAAPEEEPRAQVIDLMQALKASLASNASGRKPARSAAKSVAKTARKRSARGRGK